MKPRRPLPLRPLAAGLLLAACALAGAANAASLAKDEYRLDHDRAQAAYRLQWDSCRKLQGNAKDTCKVEARGRFQLAKAQIEAKYKQSPANEDRVKLAQADADYRLALEKCGDLRGKARDVCKADAKAASVAAHSEIRLSRVAVDKGIYSRQAIEQRDDAREDKADALYDAAKERCGALAGDARDACLRDAKRKFRRL
ncbi:hypothetical protein ACFPOE_18675 [Caenimonas terrae]|uniref:Uncharacterized protein n=1 Tax=Caenimonas terrae TaxID=696074 RepID=A0ABW0NKD5_9BURK